MKRISLLFFTLLALAQPLAAQQASPKKTRDLMALGGAGLTAMLQLRDADPTNNLEQMASDQMDVLNAYLGLNVKFSISNGSGTFSHPVNGITLDTTQLTAIDDKATVARVKEVIGWILAHEMGHMQQFHDYGTGFLDGTDGDLRVYECQADILASYAFTTKLVDPARNVSHATADVLHVAYDIGFETYSVGDHPTQAERRLAAQFGMSAGMIERLAPLAERQPFFAQDGPRGSIKVLRNRIDFPDDESLMDWSFRQSKRIVHTVPDDLQNLRLVTEQVDEDATGNMSQYNLVYKNIGTKPLKIDMEIGMYLVDPTQPDDLQKRMKGDARNLRFTLDPGEKKELSGQLPNTVNGLLSGDYTSRLIYYPKAQSIISCEAVDTVLKPGSHTSTTIPADQ